MTVRELIEEMMRAANMDAKVIVSIQTPMGYTDVEIDGVHLYKWGGACIETEQIGCEIEE